MQMLSYLTFIIVTNRSDYRIYFSSLCNSCSKPTFLSVQNTSYSMFFYVLHYTMTFRSIPYRSSTEFLILLLFLLVPFLFICIFNQIFYTSNHRCYIICIIRSPVSYACCHFFLFCNEFFFCHPRIFIQR